MLHSLTIFLFINLFVDTKFPPASNFLSTSFSDKICDIISDTVLDYCLERDENARVACDCAISGRKIVIMGEVGFSSQYTNLDNLNSDIHNRTISKLEDIGFFRCVSFEPQSMQIEILLRSQSRQLSTIVSQSDVANDQGFCFGFACRETERLMPLACTLAHSIVIEHHRRSATASCGWLRNDCKVQVITRSDSNGETPRAKTAIRIESITFSTLHDGDKSVEDVRQKLRQIVDKVLEGTEYIDAETIFKMQPGGSWTVGSSEADSGLTGRKIVTDCYGSAAPHGGGAFSGKDLSKIDRSGAYGARQIAKSIVAAGLALKCLITLGFSVNCSDIVVFDVETFGTSMMSESDLMEKVKRKMPLTAKLFREMYEKKVTNFSTTACHGHMGYWEMPWEKIIPL
ncbi:MAG: hypothetical protein MHMPM18_000663 [Marteilia pararefringens]